MKRTCLALLAVLSLTACSDTPSNPSASPTTTVAHVSRDSALPIDAMPAPVSREDNTPCPYLATEFVAETNGQRVLAQGIDPAFATPACTFYSYADEPQLTVLVRDMATQQEAINVVDWAAPIDSTEPAEEPAGWQGGRLGSPGRSVYAVFKNNHAVVVFSNQDQSLKAELVAKEAIKNLGL
ncbi:DUF2020 domain-containing protein [Staphylococcus chromogenes]|nr:DUF2020 domain-containing protein [Staphylococcus chromogenes]